MSGEPTFCEHCAHVYKVNKTDAPWLWLCIKHPRAAGYGFVCKGLWTKHLPYLRCDDVNGGRCPLFQQAAPGQMKLMAEDGQ